jgi:DNA-binding response OmpR family regulator
MRILVADDSNFMRGQIIRMLKAKLPQAEIDDAADGEVAVDKFSQDSYDLVLLDLLMPKINGDGALKRIREMSQDVLVVILSADVQKMTREDLLVSGADLFLNKPISMEKVDQIINLLQTRGIATEEV